MWWCLFEAQARPTWSTFSATNRNLETAFKVLGLIVSLNCYSSSVICPEKLIIFVYKFWPKVSPQLHLTWLTCFFPGIVSPGRPQGHHAFSQAAKSPLTGTLSHQTLQNMRSVICTGATLNCNTHMLWTNTKRSWCRAENSSKPSTCVKLSKVGSHE